MLPSGCSPGVLARLDSIALDEENRPGGGQGTAPGSTPVHLVTILYNSERALRPFLDSLLAQDMRDWRLTAVDNASTDGAARVIGELADSRVDIVRNAVNLGFAKAANQGLRHAARRGAGFSVLINNDTAFAPDFLRKFLAARDRLDAGVISPRIMYLDDPERSWYAGGHFDRNYILKNVHETFDPADPQEWREVGFASGCCLGITRQVLDTVGLLDESFFVYWEDSDFSLRLAAAGIPIVYVRDPFIYHEGGGSSSGEHTPAYNRLYYRSYMQMLRKHHGLRYAVRAMARILALAGRQQGASRHGLLVLAQAMARGLMAPLVPVPRLDAGGGTQP